MDRRLSVLVAVLLVLPISSCATMPLKVLLSVPRRALEEASVILHVGRTSKDVSDILRQQDGRAPFEFGGVSRGTEIRVEYSSEASDPPIEKSVSYDPGSARYVELQFDEAFQNQSAEITWKVTAGTARIYVDNEEVGTTVVSSGVRPGRRRFVWEQVSPQKRICQYSFTVKEKDTLTFVCDRTTGSVSIQGQ